MFRELSQSTGGGTMGARVFLLPGKKMRRCAFTGKIFKKIEGERENY